MRKGEQKLVSSVSLMNCTSVGLNVQAQQSSNSFGFCVLFGSRISSWSLKHFLMFFAKSSCQECFGFVCYSLQLSYSLVLFLAPSPPSLLVATVSGLDHCLLYLV